MTSSSAHLIGEKTVTYFNLMPIELRSLYSVELVTVLSQEEMVKFLIKNENYNLFLLSNFEKYGGILTEAPFSGNFKLIRFQGDIVAVFCLTSKGNLLIDATVKEPIFDILLEACSRESIPLNGIIGRWDFCEMFWDYLNNKKIINKETYRSKEILYTFELCEIDTKIHSNARMLLKTDYAQWKTLRLNYFSELGISHDMTEKQLETAFFDKVAQKSSWGYFLGDELVSIADLNIKVLDLGQIGGVYTAPHARQMGYSKFLIKQLLLDARQIHCLRKLIILTNEQNFPAQKLYSSLGGTQNGYFAFLFGCS